MQVRSGVAVACLLLVAACGTTTQQRVATGGLTGGGIGALAGGPIGALIGGGVGAVAGWVTPKSADDMALALLRSTREPSASAVAAGSGASGTRAATGAGGSVPPAPPEVTRLQISPETAKHIQTTLRNEGLYQGPIDGIIGPRTERALASYQEQHGLQKSSALDTQTLQMLTSSTTDNVGSTTPQPTPSEPGSDASERQEPPATAPPR
jgi:hypothetical protein